MTSIHFRSVPLYCVHNILHFHHFPPFRIFILLFQIWFLIFFLNGPQMAVDWVTVNKFEHPFPDATEPKRRFVPSKWENKKVGDV